MKYLNHYEDYNKINEGIFDNLKKMASIGLLTTSMLIGNSSIAQEYKSIDSTKQKEISNIVQNNKVFRIGGIKMGMSMEELKSIGIKLVNIETNSKTNSKRIEELKKSEKESLLKIFGVSEDTDIEELKKMIIDKVNSYGRELSVKLKPKEVEKIYKEYNEFIKSSDFINYSRISVELDKFYRYGSKRTELIGTSIPLNISNFSIGDFSNFSIGIDELEYLNNKGYRIVYIPNYKISNDITLEGISIIFYKNKLSLIYSDILTTGLVDKINISEYSDIELYTNTYGWIDIERKHRNPIGTNFCVKEFKSKFENDMKEIEQEIKKEKSNIKSKNTKDIFGD